MKYIQKLVVVVLAAKVNGKLVPFSHTLKSDQVEIITSNKQSPKEDWLSFVKTSTGKI